VQEYRDISALWQHSRAGCIGASKCEVIFERALRASIQNFLIMDGHQPSLTDSKNGMVAPLWQKSEPPPGPKAANPAGAIPSYPADLVKQPLCLRDLFN
jgi:hypothetical protein